MKVNTKIMEWIRAPKLYNITEDVVEMITEPFTDLWQRTPRSKQHLLIWK